MTPNSARTGAIAWNGLRKYGQVMSGEFFLDVSYQWATWFAGSNFAKGSQKLFGNDPLTITLAPDLDPNNESVKYLVKLSSLEEVECLVAPELAQQLETELGAMSWRIEKQNDYEIAIWSTRRNSTTRMPLTWFSNVTPDILITNFRDQLGNDVPKAVSYFHALQVHHDTPMRSLFVTQNKHVLHGRYKGWPNQIGQCTPEEALILASLILRQRNIFIDTLRPSGRVVPHRYNWYCGAAQALLRSYLNTFADLVTDAERRNETNDLALQYLEGILTRFKSLLRFHDQLGELHFRALCKGAGNDIIEEQSDIFYSATQSAAGILEGIAVLLAKLDGTVRSNDWRSVGFPALVAGTHRWTKGINKYRPAADAAITSNTPLLTLVTGQRLQGFHYFPVMGTAGEFGEVIPVRMSDGTYTNRIIPHISLPLIRIPELPDDVSWIKNGVDGIIFTEGQLFLLPWPALRGAIRDLIILVEETFRQVCIIRAVTSEKRETAFLSSEGRDLARRMLDFDNHLQDDGSALLA